MPDSPFAPAVAVAGVLRTHCQYEAALKWYELAFAPLSSNSSWCFSDSNQNRPSAVEATGWFDERAQRRSITLHYAETMLDWGDAVLRRNTPESFQQARLIFDTVAKLLGARPRTIQASPKGEPSSVADFSPLAAPVNPRLLALYDHSTDRLDLIHACLNASRLRNGAPGSALGTSGDMPYFGNTTLRAGWRSGAQPCLDDVDWCAPQSPYRFVFVVQKAVEIVGEVRAQGAALLAAYEKGDAEYLASLRANHENQLLNLATQIRQNQWRESDWQVQALRKTKEITQTRRNYQAMLIQNGLLSKEIENENLTDTGMALRTASNVVEGIAQIMG
ncbi:MAG: hypothetical protein ACREXP_30725, partial [Steroidobacteraceae bacterium]